MNRTRFVLRSCAAATFLALLVPAVSASAHVHVDSDNASAGGYAKLVFRVPTESDTASTTKVTVDLPTDTPFAFVSTEPVPGWTVERTETKLPEPVTVGDFTLSKAVTQIVWTATGSGLGPGEFQEFDVSVGPLPDEGTELMFPATQEYSDGETVAWDQETPATGKEPEHPAPVLTVGPAEDSHGDSASSDAHAEHADVSEPEDSDAAWWGIGLGAVALVVAVAALVTAVRGRPRKRSEG